MWDWLFFWKWWGKPPEKQVIPPPAETVEPLERAAGMFVQPPPAEPKLEPVLVRGDAWKNTAADARMHRSQPETQPTLGIQGLIQKLRHKEARVRALAAEALGKGGPEAREAIPPLLLAACDAEASVCNAATEALARIDPGWPASPGATEAVPALIGELGRGSSDIGKRASFLLSRIGEPAVSGLARALGDGGSDIAQVLVARTLGRLGGGAAPAVPALAGALASEFTHVRQAAAEALAEIGSAAEPAIPTLVGALSDWQPKIRGAAARCLARIGGSAESAVPGLIQLLPDREDEVREAAVEALARIGPTAVPWLMATALARDIQQVQERLKWSEDVSDLCDRAISESRGAEGRKAVRNYQWYFGNAIEENLRMEMLHESALRALGKIGPGAAPAVSVLEEALADPNPKIRIAAARALGQIGRRAVPATPALVRRLFDSRQPVRQVAVESLGQVDADWALSDSVTGCLPSLVEFLKRSGEEGQVAVEALAVIGPASVPALIDALASDDRIMRESAAHALGRIGPPARAALPALRGAAQDKSGWVREAAEEALRKVDPPDSLNPGEGPT